MPSGKFAGGILIMTGPRRVGYHLSALHSPIGWTIRAPPRAEPSACLYRRRPERRFKLSFGLPR